MSFIPFGTDDSVVSSEAITAALWSSNVYNLSSSFFTSSTQQTSTSGKSYLNVYNLAFGASGSETQFSVAYGHISGSGSTVFNSSVDEKSPTRDIYGQYRNLVYGDEASVFNFGGSNGNSRDIYVINVNRARYKQAIAPGTWGLKLTNSTSSIMLSDDSNSTTTTTFVGGNRVYNIVSGSLGYTYNTSSVQTDSGSYGLFFPDMGILVLNPRALSLTYNGKFGIGLTPDETAATSYSLAYNTNASKVYNAISASNGNFFARSQETVSSTYFFVNAKSSQLNYTTNPSIIDTNGNVLYSTLVNDPQTYPTTIGMYNDAGELLAVAKLSKPLAKDFTKQLTCRVKLEF